MNLSAIDRLIRDEQALQNGEFVRNADLGTYIEKLKKNAEFLIHCSNGELAAFVAFYCNDPNKHCAFITLVLTKLEFRGKKIADGLVEGVMSLVEKRGFDACQLEVKKDNEVALALYQKKKFKIVKELNESLLMERRFK